MGKKLSKVKKGSLKKTPRAELKALELANDVDDNPKKKGAAKKVIIRKVRIASSPPEGVGVKNSGRPKGSLAKAKREVEEAGQMVAA